MPLVCLHWKHPGLRWFFWDISRKFLKNHEHILLWHESGGWNWCKNWVLTQTKILRFSRFLCAWGLKSRCFKTFSSCQLREFLPRKKIFLLSGWNFYDFLTFWLQWSSHRYGAFKAKNHAISREQEKNIAVCKNSESGKLEIFSLRKRFHEQWKLMVWTNFFQSTYIRKIHYR